MINYHQILGTSEGDSKEKIKQVYRKLILKWHPDKNKNSTESIKMTQKLNEAFEILSSGKGSVAKYGYDYNEEVPIAKDAVVRAMDGMNTVYPKLHRYFADRKEEDMVGDYHLIRAKKILQALSSYKKLFNGNSGEFNMKVGMNLESGFAWWSGNNSWDTNVNHFKNLVNFARGALALPPLTDQDLQIEGKSSGETPQIPGKEKPKITGSKFDDYNKLYSRKNHAVHREFEKLYQEIIGQFYSKNGQEWNQAGYDKLAKLPSFAEAYEKIKKSSNRARQLIPHDADASLESRIKADNDKDINDMREAIEAAKKLLAESKNNNSSISKGQNSKVNEVENKKRKIEIEALEGNQKKSRTIADELDRLISEAKEKNDYGELEAIIKKIDGYQGEEAYNSHQEKINQLKASLGKLDKDKFRELTIKKIKDMMKDSKLEASELDQETREGLERLKHENDINQITELENKISEKIGQKGALNTLSSWLKRAEELTKGVKKGTVEHLKAEWMKVKQGLYNFQSSTNLYQQSIYKEKEQDIKQALSNLENYSVQNNATQSTESLPWKIIIPVGLVAVSLVAAIIIIRKRKQAVKVK